MKTVEDNVLAFREFLKLDQDTFAKKSGMSVKRLNSIEKSKVDISLKEVQGICQAFYISSDYILGRMDKPSPMFENESEAKMWNRLLSLTDKEKEMVLNKLEELLSDD